MKTIRLIRSITLELTGAMLVVLLLAPFATAASMFVSSDPTDVFRNIGFDSSGTMWIAGERSGVATLFSYSSGSLNATTLGALGVGDNTYVGAISRDARSVVGGSGDQAVLWNVSSPNNPIGLGVLPGDLTSVGQSVSSGLSPIAIGFSDVGGFIWTQASGIQPISVVPGHGETSPMRISANGDVFVGFASAPGIGFSDAVVYQGASTSVLNDSGGIHSLGLAISPNGTVFGGEIDNQGAIWNGGNPLRLTLDGNPVSQVLGVTDNGFAVGSTAAGGYIYDPRTGLTSLFDSWWENETGSAIGHHITSINDVFWDGTELHFALEGSAVIASASINSVPEPTSAALFTAILLFLIAFHRSQRQRTQSKIISGTSA